MVTDFTHIKEIVKGQLDHQNLNNVLPCNPTAENIARWICDWWRTAIKWKSANRKEIQLSMRKINEIFYSLQGEGFHTGTPAVFVRFSGCNLKCNFCDTQHEKGILLSDEEIINQVNSYPCRMVILTGGETGL